MSYKNNYQVSISSELTFDEKTLIKNLCEFSEDYNFLIKNSGLWWNFEKDMMIFSQKNPDILFQLDIIWETGFGKNPSRYYFMNGKSQKAKTTIVYETFNNNL